MAIIISDKRLQELKPKPVQKPVQIEPTIKEIPEKKPRAKKIRPLILEEPENFESLNISGQDF